MSENLQWTANKRPNLMAMISAHPMLWPFLSQPGRSFHDSHSSPKMTPIPQDEEVSTQNSIGEGVGGLDRVEPQKSEESRTRHHSISEQTLRLGVFRVKGDVAKSKEAANREMDGNRERPSGTAREQCTRVPRIDSVSFLENF